MREVILHIIYVFDKRYPKEYFPQPMKEGF